MTTDAIQRRVVEQAMRLVDGDLDAVADWLTSVGLHVIERGERLTVQGVSGATVGMSRGMDPITAASQLAHACLGALWSFAMPDLLKWVNAAWKERPGLPGMEGA